MMARSHVMPIQYIFFKERSISNSTGLNRYSVVTLNQWRWKLKHFEEEGGKKIEVKGGYRGTPSKTSLGSFVYCLWAILLFFLIFFFSFFPFLITFSLFFPPIFLPLNFREDVPRTDNFRVDTSLPSPCFPLN